MFKNALTLNNVSYKMKITYKAIVSAGLIALAVILPQIVHIAQGQSGGVKWLPMYLPVLIGGCLLGAKWGLCVGILSPLASFIITSAMGDPMPMAAKLPFMMAELSIFAIISGLFTKRIAKNGLMAFPAVISAQIVGRAAFLGLVAVSQFDAPFTAKMIWNQIQEGIYGLIAQTIIVPLIIIALRKLMLKEQDND